MSMVSYARDQFSNAIQNYTKDLEVLDEADLTAVPAGKARTIKDFTYEVIVVNEQIRCMFMGEEPPAWPADDESWVTAPAEYSTKAQLIAAMKEGADKVLASYDSLGEEGAMAMKETQRGPRNAVQRMLFMQMHVMYHAAQINYFQSMKGDLAMHW